MNKDADSAVAYAIRCGRLAKLDAWERKPCVSCGYVRRVRVRYPGSFYADRTPQWTRICRACEAEVIADKWARASAMWSARARAYREAQARAGRAGD